MYIGARGDGGKPRERVNLPEKYSGNAFTDDGVLRVTDKEALRIAEESFKRGYVFEKTDDTAIVPEETDVSEKAEPAAAEAVHISEAADTEKSADVPASAVPLRSGGVLSGILSGITIEHIVLLTAIIILWDSRSDDELLLLLIVLFFC